MPPLADEKDIHILVAKTRHIHHTPALRPHPGLYRIKEMDHGRATADEYLEQPDLSSEDDMSSSDSSESVEVEAPPLGSYLVLGLDGDEGHT
jgi:hypothetical protein